MTLDFCILAQLAGSEKVWWEHSGVKRKTIPVNMHPMKTFKKSLGETKMGILIKMYCRVFLKNQMFAQQ